jgi:glycosyl-4,4'-diaponeurosporenoate acyltransferase
MWIDIPNFWIAVINCVGIAAAHLLIAWGFTRLPASVFHSATTGPPRSSCRFYERVFFVRRWKGLLPDAAPWFGGIAKAKLKSTDPAYLESFAAETRRGECSHWLQLLTISGFILWTPWPASLGIIAWAFFSNLPCIISLRHTRLRILQLRHRIEPW